MDALFKLSESAASSVSSMFNKEEKYQEIGMGDFGENEGISGRDVESGGRKGLVDYVEDGFSLSYTQRLYGFVSKSLEFICVSVCSGIVVSSAYFE